jgi:spore germination protein
MIDFERLPVEDRALYNDFLRQAADRLRGAGLLLATAVAAPRHASDLGEWSAAHDHRFHGEVADFVVLMAYQWTRPEGRPRAALPDVRAAVRFALERMPAEKLMLGVPLYGYERRMDGAGKTRSLSVGRALELAERHGAEIEYDSREEAPFFRYRDDAGVERVVWFEDRRSLHAKLDVVRAFGLRGVSLWRLPAGYDPVWELIDELFAVRPAESADGALELLAA